MKLLGIIAAGGSGTRLGHAGGKQLLPLAGRPVAAWAADALARACAIDEVVIVCDPDRLVDYTQSILSALQTDKPVTFVAGGNTRAESVVAGLYAARELGADYVAIHDGARPLLDPADTDALVAALLDAPAYAGAALAYPVTDTIKCIEPVTVAAPGNRHAATVTHTADRSSYWQVQTPQLFATDTIIDAYETAAANGFSGTDDASYVEATGGTILLIQGRRSNIKVTEPDDLLVVEPLLQQRNTMWKAR
ncbi:MAG: 2-C-methyl-D-erythritol 4-phosphate cytidylyltransferase [Actinomycetes bacterium]|jgi:2-C-methyl-D-erythritol 4-phosphate cytidylyltransferase|nr:2-C-methyl-D-erythritol 4-phosphate cytidylyltransferase [Actinomycetes bacterium]